VFFGNLSEIIPKLLQVFRSWQKQELSTMLNIDPLVSVEHSVAAFQQVSTSGS
jgi:hypothetical protein